MRLRPRLSARRPKKSAPSTAPPIYADAAQPISPAVRPSVSGRSSAGPSEPTTVTSRPSSSQLTPSAITTRQCHGDQGSRSRRAGMAVTTESSGGIGIVLDREGERMIGFIGVGVMGEPICRHLASKSGKEVRAYDTNPEPLERLKAHGVKPMEGVREVAEKSEMVFLSLPGAVEVKQVCVGRASLLIHQRPGTYIIDLSTTPVALTRDLEARFSARGIHFIDAPVARTRAAAEEGKLSVMVGCKESLFPRVKPLLEHFASEITRCGPAGAGQAMKLINNMVLFQNVVALAEALAVIRKLGLDPAKALEVLSKGSADSFALRHHAIQAMLPNKFPEKAFSVEYALKDVSYALELAKIARIELSGLKNAKALLEKAAAAGHTTEYFPVIAKLI